MFESLEKSPDVCLISLERSWFVRPIWCVPRSSGAGGEGGERHIPLCKFHACDF